MSPIKAENRSRYPADWPVIAAYIKNDRAGGRCECDGRCGKTGTIRHGSKVGTRCINMHNSPAYDTGSRVILTVAHLDHTPENCDDGNLLAMCQACHLAYDAPHHAATRAATIAARKAVA